MEKRQQFSFVWGFNGGDAVTLQSCTPISIFVDRDPENGTAAQPVPPYTVIAYPEQGIPTVDTVGTTSTLTWTPRFPAGTKILISLVDAVGNSGGVAQTTYVVAAGSSTSCVPASSTSSVQLSVDAPDTIPTCDTVNIRIQGGSTPYSLSIAATNAASSVNETMSASNNYYQWINRAAPAQSLIIAVSDSTGQYATTSKFFQTSGTNDTSCSGQTDSQSVYGAGGNTSSGSPSSSSASASTTIAAATSHKSGSTGPIVGVIIGLLLLFGAIALWFFRKRKTGSYDHGSTTGAPGFGMKDYKRGENLSGNESFVPLHDGTSPIASATPLHGDHSPNSGGSFGGSVGARPVSGFDYYSSPPSNYSGTMETSGPSSMGPISPSSHQNPSGRTGLGVGLAAAGVGAAGAVAAGHQTKRQMMLEEQQRQRWPGAMHSPAVSESVYPPQSAYSVNSNPFADPIHPYRPGAPSVIVSEAAPVSPAYGYAGQGTRPTSYQPSHAQSRAAGSSQDSSLTPAARAKAAEAARERVPSVGYDDDEDPIPYMQRQRPILGVTNPDRASTATNTSTNDPYGGIDRSRPPTQVYQHEDAGAVVELPPAYREFPGAGAGAPPHPQ